MRYWLQLATEQAGFDGINVSDHFQPWWRRRDYFTDDWHDPKAMYERAEKEVSDDDFKESYIVSSDPEQHVERIREIEQLGATVVCLQNGSGAAPEQALDVYGKSVLPTLR